MTQDVSWAILKSRSQISRDKIPEPWNIVFYLASRYLICLRLPQTNSGTLTLHNRSHWAAEVSFGLTVRHFLHAASQLCLEILLESLLEKLWLCSSVNPMDSDIMFKGSEPAWTSLSVPYVLTPLVWYCFWNKYVYYIKNMFFVK